MPAATAVEALRVPADALAITEADRWIERVGARWGLAEPLLFRARVCVSELANNVLEHGRLKPDAGHIAIELRHVPPGLEIEMSDPGAAFDLSTAPDVEPGEDRVGGRGLRLVRAYAHGITYRRHQDRNVVTFRLTPTPA
jgi:anti-sigma regulatory factor (Ser/Thr protein kinase)